MLKFINLFFKNVGVCINLYSVIFFEFFMVENGIDFIKY